MKSKTIGYTTQKLNRDFRKPTFASTTKVVFQRISNSIPVDIIRFYIGKVAKYVNKFNESPTVRLYLTNGRKHNQRERMEQFCRDFNRHRNAMRVVNHFGNPKPYNEAETQMFINELKFGKW
jgi:hypothetical protein